MIPTAPDPEEKQAIHLPLEQVKFGSRRRPGYALVEAGEPTVTDIVNETLESWEGMRGMRQPA